MPINSIKKRTLHRSRQSKMRNNPIPWVILFIFSGVLIYIGAPKYSEWNQKKSEIQILTPQNDELLDEKDNLLERKNKLKNQFNKAAELNANLEEQLFPQKISSSKVAQVFEIYSLLLKEAGGRSAVVDLKSLNIGSTSPQKGENYSTTSVNINIDIDKTNFKRFLTFIQNNKISNKLKDAIISKSSKANPSIDFLENNILPIGTVSAIGINKIESKQYSSRIEVFNVQLQLLLYSQK